MQEIVETAEQIVAWLGEQIENAHLAIEVIVSLYQHRRAGLKSRYERLRHICDIEHEVALTKFFERPCLSRV